MCVKELRRISSILPAVFLAGLVSWLGLLQPKPVFAANASVSSSSGAVTVGSNITTTVSLNTGGNNVDAVAINLSYPADKLQCVSINTSADFNIAPGGDVCSGGTVHADRGRTSNFASNATLLTVTFKALAAGSAPVTVAGSTSAYTAGVQLPTSGISGTITVNNPPAPPPPPAPSPPPSPSPGPSPSPSPSYRPSPSTPTSPVISTPSGVDRTSPQITNVKVTGIESTSAIVTWNTNEPANSRVEYGLTTSYGLTAGGDALTTNHRVELNPQLLQKGATFHLRAKSMDAAGNSAFSADVMFQTKGFDVTILVTDKEGSPIEGAYVTYRDETKKADASGAASFTNVGYGKQKITIRVGLATTNTSIHVGQTDSTGNVAPQKFVLQASSFAFLNWTTLLIIVLIGAVVWMAVMVKKRLSGMFGGVGGIFHGKPASFQLPPEPPKPVAAIPGIDQITPSTPQPGSVYNPSSSNDGAVHAGELFLPKSPDGSASDPKKN